MAVIAECTWWENTGKMTGFVDGISSPIMRRLDTGEERSSRDLPIGALYEDRYASRSHNVGYDGKGVICILPGKDGETDTWYIDGRCSNCTRKGEDHHCWVRHGSIGERVHVDKSGNTCAAGSGSIQTDDWHGFLHNHQLTTG